MVVTEVLTDFALSTGEQEIVFLFALHHED